MEASIFTSFDHDLLFAQAVPLIYAAGFEVIAMGGREQIRKVAVSNQARVESVHAPFPEADQFFSLDEGNRVESFRQCKLAVDASAYLRAGAVAVHLIPRGI